MKPWSVCYPRKYAQKGEERTHFVPVGAAWPLTNREGFKVQLWFRVLPGDTLLLFPPQASETSDAAMPPAEDEALF